MILTLQEIIKSLDELSVEEQTSLLNVLKQRLTHSTQMSQMRDDSDKKDPIAIVTPPLETKESFWDITLRFRALMERENIEFTDEDFADLRERSPGREVEIEC